MGLLSKTGKSTSTSTSAPWSAQQPYLEQGFSAADDLFNAAGPAYFPDSGVAGFSPDQLAAQDMIRETAMAGSDTMDAANSFVTDTLGGVNDPYGDSVFENIKSKVMPSINSQWMMKGREGSNLYGDTMGRSLTESFAPWASQNWQFGKNMQMDAAKFAPDLRKMDYFDAGALGLVGKEQQDMAQAERDDAKARWDYYQNLPYEQLNRYMNTVGGQQWGSQGTSTTPVQKPTGLGEALGAGLSILGGVGDIFGGSIF